MTDKARELLELAAKAAGIDGIWSETWNFKGGMLIDYRGGIGHWYWNPLTDDGDALRLAVQLGIDIEFYSDAEKGLVYALNRLHPLDSDNNANEPYGDDPYAATRRAIVRAAAEIGRSMG